MPLPQPVPGLVVHYSYLWHDQKLRGLEEGTKERPCVIVSTAVVPEGITIVLAPITHRAPRAPHEGIEVPAPTKQRLGMDNDRSWIMVNDFNRFLWPGPDLRPVPNQPGNYAYGLISPKLLQRAKDSLFKCARTGEGRATDR